MSCGQVREWGALWWPAFPGVQTHWGPRPMLQTPSPWFGPVQPGPYACPLLPLVGACCSGCAEGKGCSGEDEIKHAAAEIVGDVPGFAEKALPWSDVEAFDATVRKLDTDVRSKGNAGMQFVWLTEIVGFWPRWRAWFDATKASWFGTIFGGLAITGPTLKTFEDFRHEFNALVDQFKAAGLDTGAAPVDTTDKSPVEKGLEQGGEGIGKGIGTALSTLGQGIVWIGVAVVAGVAIYFGAPLVIKRLVAR